MMRRVSVVLLWLLLAVPAMAQDAQPDSSFGWSSFRFGGRASYDLFLDEASVPFSWNSTTQSALDRTRIMVDVRALATPYGSLYLKGVGLWDDRRDLGRDTPFFLKQGDYLWAQAGKRVDYGVRLFYSERRFFVRDQIAPLILDDRTGETGENGGVRGDFDIADRVDVTALYSMLGDDFERSRRIGYLRTAYKWRLAQLSLSYLLDDPGVSGPANQATLKVEYSMAWRRMYFVLSYAQTGFGSGVFLPDGHLDWSRLDGHNISQVLPDGSAMFFELRLREFTIKKSRLRFAYRWGSLGRSYTNDLAQRSTATVGQDIGFYLDASEVAMRGKLRYLRDTRVIFENAVGQGLEAAFWGTLKEGTELLARATYGVVEEEGFADTKQNFIHLGLAQQKSRFRTGAHVMWKDLDTVNSDLRFAWDGRLAVNGSFAFYWRFLIRREFNLSDAIYNRFEYRPSNRVWLTLSYGRQFMGDAPYVVEDIDVGLVNPDAAVYRILLRGDF